MIENPPERSAVIMSACEVFLSKKTGRPDFHTCNVFCGEIGALQVTRRRHSSRAIHRSRLRLRASSESVERNETAVVPTHTYSAELRQNDTCGDKHNFV